MPIPSNQYELLNRLHGAHTELLRSGEHSLPDDAGGRTLIVTGYAKDHSEEVVLRHEAAVVQGREIQRVSYDYERVIGLLQSNDRYKDEVIDAISDRSVNRVILIGNGTLGGFMVNEVESLTWADTHEMDHLKGGGFIQRTCGHLDPKKSEVRMPIGTFFVEDQRDVWVPLFETPGTLSASPHDIDQMLVQPFDRSHMSLTQLAYATRQSKLVRRSKITSLTEAIAAPVFASQHGSVH